MSDRPDDLEDDLLGRQLESAFAATPERLSERLERLTAVGLRPGGAVQRAPFPWRELVPRWLSAALVLTLIVGAGPRLIGLLKGSASLGSPLPGPGLAPAASAAFSALLLPVGMLLVAEALRGAPTVRRWLR